MLHLLIRPQIARAHARASDTNESVSRLNDLRIGHVLDPNVASFIHDSCAQNNLPPVTLGLRLNTNSGNLFSSPCSQLSTSRVPAQARTVLFPKILAPLRFRAITHVRDFSVSQKRESKRGNDSSI